MKLFSLNIWFSDYLRHERTQILTKYLLENDYDIIFLQEVIPCVLAYIYQTIQEKYPWFSNLFISLKLNILIEKMIKLLI